MKNVEVELKFPLYNYEELMQKLNSIAEGKEEYQKDVYYTPKHRNFLEKKTISEWLRIREESNKFILTYKNWHNDKNRAVSCDEFETQVEKLSSLKKIFENLNFKEIIVVEKIRSIWEYSGVLIAIDKVKDLGYFIELEAKGDFKNIEEAKKHLYSVLEELNAEVGSQDFKGYPYLLLEKRKL